MRSARIALYKSKKIADRSCSCAFHGFGFDGNAGGAPACRRRARLRDSEWSLTRRIGDRDNQARACGISPCVQRRRIETASAGINQRIGEIRRIQDGIIVPKQNRRPESISNPGRRSSITAKQATRDYRCAAALPCIMPMPRSPAPSPSSRVRCPDRCRRAGRQAALPTSRPRPPRSSCRPRWWPSGPCRGTCRRP